MKTPIQWDTFAWVTVLVGIALLFAFDALEHVKHQREFESHAKIVKGTVTDSSEGYSTGGREPEYEPPFVEYRFMVDQREYTGTSSGEFVKVGTEIEVEYSPMAPETNRMMGTVSEHASNSAFLAMFCAVFAACLIGGAAKPESGEVRKEIPFATFPFIVLTAGTAIMLFCTRDTQVYPYDHVIRWVTCGVCIYAAVTVFLWRRKIARWPIIPLAFVILAIVFNPVAQFGFSAATVFTLHTGAAVLMLAAASMFKPEDRSDDACEEAVRK